MRIPGISIKGMFLISFFFPFLIVLFTGIQEENISSKRGEVAW